MGLWVLVFLGGLAVAVGVQVAARLELARRLDGRLRGRSMAQLAAAKAVAVLDADTNGWDGFSERWAASPGDFSNSVATGGSYALIAVRDVSDGTTVTNFGLNDESARVDINAARTPLLSALLQTAGGIGAAQAAALAAKIEKSKTPKDRDPEAGAAGGAPEGRGPFLSIHELRLVEGLNPALFDKLRDVVTVGGGSRVNVNTAGRTVLLSVARAADPSGTASAGVAGALVRKVLKFRESGGMFTSYAGLGMAAALTQREQLSGDEAALFQKMSAYLAVSSDRFRGVAWGGATGKGGPSRVIEFVWDRRQRKMVFWHED